MTELLVSVRSAAEANAALAGGADWIDVKEPQRGALGYANAATLRAIAAVVGRRAPLSAALGEISDRRPAELNAALENYQFAKLGLAGAAAITDWPEQWRTTVAPLGRRVRPVAVAYADWQTCGAPPPTEVLQQGMALQCAALLVDTYAKNGSTTFDFLPSDTLAELLAAAREAGLRTVLAGSLQLRDLPDVFRLAPDLIAVRGAVCRGGRAGEIDAALVAEFRCEMARKSLTPEGELARELDVKKFA